MASVHRTAHGFEVRAYAGRDASTGSVRNLYRHLPPDAHEGEVEAAKAELQAVADRFKGTGEPFTLRGVLEFYFGTLEGQRSPTYIDGLRSNARCHLYPALGNRRVDTVRPYEILNVYSAMRAPESKGGKGLSPNTVVKLNAWLSRAFGELCGMGVMRSNPLAEVSAPKPADYEAQPLKEKDLSALAAYLKAAMRSPSPSSLDASLWVCLNTGLRAGELAGLRCSDLEPERSVIRVTHSLARASGRGLFYKEPKSRRSRRSLTVGDATMRVALRCAERSRVLCRVGNQPVFCTDNGSLVDPRAISAHFRSVADSLGIGKYAHLHTLRHTHATYLLLNGTPIRVVQERLGHSDVRTTLGIYGHVLPGYDAEAAARFDSILESLE